jgi:Asp-tRNA(Asn)/Glu-tRNA(Gln) amidotransferase A subunit family amidase
VTRAELTAPARGLAASLRARDCSAADVTEACLERIAEREPALHAWACLDPDSARRQARALDAGPIRGPLHGLPLGVKDIFDTVELPTAYGSPAYRDHRPAADAACVALARAAGAVVLGKTATTEFAAYSPSATVNPHNLACSPGGFSSGSAAAVADAMTPLAFGTQTAGSIIRPASFCGVVGYKPTFGMIGRAGVKLLAESLDTVGVFARHVADAALLVGALTARGDLLELPDVSGLLRIGMCRTHEPS